MAMASDSDDSASAKSDDSFRFMPTNVGDSEELELYRKGGFHPVHLGDLYDGLRYQIVHKLGAGGFSTIWLARDLHCQTWIAVKILVADKSPEVEEKMVSVQKIMNDTEVENCISTRYFHIEGPNGRHLCLAIPLCGPSTHVMSRYLQSRIHPQLARSTALKAAQSVADLHSRGLCHGDITPSNLVFKLQNIDHLDDKGIYSTFGEPKIGSLETYAGDIPGPEAPRYIVGYMDFMRSQKDFLLEEISLIDFDQAFPTYQPPKKRPGIPPSFLAPEVAAGEPASPASDVWALGCAILNIRAGSNPFDVLNIDCPAQLMRWHSEFIGALPEKWIDRLYDFEGEPTEDEEEGETLSDLPAYNESALRDWIGEIWDQPENAESLQSSSAAEVTGQEENNAYPECYKHKFWKPSALKIDDTYLSGYCDKVDEIIKRQPKISTHERDLLHDLMRKIFVYDPEVRPSAEEVVAHPWFRMVKYVE